MLINEFGGPTQSEGAVDMAIRVLRLQSARLNQLTKEACALGDDRIARAGETAAETARRLHQELRDSNQVSRVREMRADLALAHQ